MEHIDVNNLRANWLRIFHDLSGPEQIDAANDVFSDHSLREKSALVLCELFEKDVSFLEMVRLLSRLPALRTEKQNIRKIGLVVRWLNNGGVERVVALLIPILQKAGFEVVLLTNEAAKDTDYPVPGDVLRIVLPESGTERMESLMIAIKEQSLDALFIHNYSKPVTMFDILAGKVQGIPSVMTWHNVFSIFIQLGVKDFLPLFEMTRFADKVIALSRCDEKFFNDFGAFAEYVPNPLTFTPDDTAKPAEDPVILFPARLSAVKQPQEAIKIFAEVLKSLPDTKMILAGAYENAEIQKEMDGLQRKLGTGHSIETLGYCNDMNAVFARSRLMLMTSSAEGFPMTILEAKSRGIPVVAYELPYVETMNPGSGVISVHQGASSAAAQQIVRLLTDRKLFAQQSNAARQDARMFAEYDLVSKYKKIFSPDALSVAPAGESESYLMLKTQMEHTLQMFTSAFRSGIQDERERITRGLTYRTGKLFTALPLWIKRKIRPE